MIFFFQKMKRIVHENNMFFAQSIDLLKTAAHLCGSPKIII